MTDAQIKFLTEQLFGPLMTGPAVQQRVRDAMTALAAQHPSQGACKSPEQCDRAQSCMHDCDSQGEGGEAPCHSWEEEQARFFGLPAESIPAHDQSAGVVLQGDRDDPPDVSLIADPVLREVVTAYGNGPHYEGLQRVAALLRQSQSAGEPVGWALHFTDERDFCSAASPIIGAVCARGSTAVERINHSAWGRRQFGKVTATSSASPPPTTVQQEAGEPVAAMRSAFEVWFCQDGDYDPEWLYGRETPTGFLYSNADTQHMWEAWQASAARYTSPPPTDAARASGEKAHPPMLKYLVGMALNHFVEDWIVPDDVSQRWKEWVRALPVEDADLEALDEKLTHEAIADVLAYLDATPAEPDAARVEANRRDAERYRWLRNEAHPDRDDTGLCVGEQDFNTWGKPFTRHFSGDKLDAAIDAALAAERNNVIRPAGGEHGE